MLSKGIPRDSKAHVAIVNLVSRQNGLDRLFVKLGQFDSGIDLQDISLDKINDEELTVIYKVISKVQ
jgi:hypothetical protein